MAPLIQTVVDLIGFVCGGTAVVFTAILIVPVLIRAGNWFGWGGGEDD